MLIAHLEAFCDTISFHRQQLVPYCVSLSPRFKIFEWQDSSLFIAMSCRFSMTEHAVFLRLSLVPTFLVIHTKYIFSVETFHIAKDAKL
jgi:hypothetical protein